MLRLIILLVGLGILAFGISQLANQPGDIVIHWGNLQIETSLLVAAIVLLAAMVVFALIWNFVRFVLRIPGLVGLAARARHRVKGYAAVSRGMIALGAGDQKTAHLAAREAEKHLADEPLALLLKAQSAQMIGDRAGAERTFEKMAKNPATRLLGLRGLHVEARRRGDFAAAHRHAAEAQKLNAVPWAAEAVLQHHAANSNWAEALAAVEQSASARLIEKSAANRQRAVLKTAIALDIQDKQPEDAVRLAREAVGLSPGLVPAAALAARLLIGQGETRKARKIIETAWDMSQHPDLAKAYLDLRSGDKASERLLRAETLLKMTPDAPEARLCVARAAVEARRFDRARVVLAPLAALDGAERPTVRACIAMAELEEAEHGPGGASREWLARAARAPRDAAWIADGVISDIWSPVSPVTGQLDAFRWERPRENLAAYVYEPPVSEAPASEAPHAAPAVPELSLSPPPAADSHESPHPDQWRQGPHGARAHLGRGRPRPHGGRRRRCR